MQPARAEKSGYLVAALLGAAVGGVVMLVCNQRHAQDDETHDVQHDGINEGTNAC